MSEPVTPRPEVVGRLAAARNLAARFGAYLMCNCGRAEIGDDGTCPRCAAEDDARCGQGCGQA